MKKLAIIFVVFVLAIGFWITPAPHDFQPGVGTPTISDPHQQDNQSEDLEVESDGPKSLTNDESNVVLHDSQQLNRLVVTVNNDSASTFEGIQRVLSESGFTTLVKSPLTSSVLTLDLPEHRIDEAIDLLSGTDGVDSVERDQIITVETTKYASDPQILQQGLNPRSSGVFPTRSNVPWNLDRIDQTGPSLDGRFSQTLTGRGVDVYVIDSGVRESHTEFANIEVRKLTAISGQFSDCSGHGTHVAATAVGRTVGVAVNARLVDMKVFGGTSCQGSTANLIAALTWIRDNHDYSRPAVVNMSVSVPFSQTVDNLVLDLHVRKILSVVASGNDSTDSCGTESPASAPWAINVNASTLSGGVDDDAWFSNYGSCTDIYAPGENIYSADRNSNSSYSTKSGTSMASPLVAGVVASILEANPSSSADLVSQKLLNAALVTNFMQGTTDAKKFLQFGPSLRGYFPQPASAGLAFLSEGEAHATWRHGQVARESIVPVTKLGVEILSNQDPQSTVLGSCMVDVSETQCKIPISTPSSSLYLRTTILNYGQTHRSTEIIEVDDYRAQSREGPWIDLSVGGPTACAIDQNQDLYCWGDRVHNSTGLIVGSTSASRPYAPIKVSSVGQVKHVEVSPSGSVCAVTIASRLYCWGTNFGNMVDNSNNHVSNPIDKGINDVRKVVLGHDGRACAITSGNSLYCWGRHLGAAGNLSSPRLVSHSIADVSIGTSAYCMAVLNVTRVVCAGSNHRGQLGDGTLTADIHGRNVAGLSGTIDRLVSSNDVTCAINNMDNLFCWGWNASSGNQALFSAQQPRSAWSIANNVSHVSIDLDTLCITERETGQIACRGWTTLLTSGVQRDASFTYLSKSSAPSETHEMAMGTICSLTQAGKILCNGFGGFGVIAAGSRLPEKNLNLGHIPFPVEVAKTISVSRVQGANRYQTAVEISKLAFPQPGPSRVFIASGENFPDALSAGPVASALEAPLLLTPRAGLNADVRVELARLNPSEVTILGGLSAVSQQVEDDLVSEGWSVSRVAGGNRYETAVMTSRMAYENSDTVFIAAGENFPDALAGSAAASKISAPLLLVQGHSPTLIPALASYLAELRPGKIYVLGGPNVVSEDVVSALGEFGNVERVAGTHRVDTSVEIAKKFFESNQTGIITFGWNFPDALAGSMLASRVGAPMYTSLHGCTHRVVVNDLRRTGANTLYVLGSEATLSARVAQLAPCD